MAHLQQMLKLLNSFYLFIFFLGRAYGDKFHCDSDLYEALPGYEYVCDGVQQVRKLRTLARVVGGLRNGLTEEKAGGSGSMGVGPWVWIWGRVMQG